MYRAFQLPISSTIRNFCTENNLTALGPQTNFMRSQVEILTEEEFNLPDLKVSTNENKPHYMENTIEISKGEKFNLTE